MHLLCSADDGIDRTGLYAQSAAYACRFIDHSDRTCTLCAIVRIEWYDWLPKQGSYTRNTFCSARWTLVVICCAVSDRQCIGSARGIAALCALCLRQ
jgi:hypothetical protein